MEKKFYRNWVRGKDLVGFEVIVDETDLFIRAEKDLKEKAYNLVMKYRKVLEEYIKKNPLFLSSLTPLKIDPQAHNLIQRMEKAAIEAEVGPMAAVAGAIAEFVGRRLLDYSKEVIIENGGDIFMKVSRKRVVAIYAGDSPLSGKIGIEISPGVTPLGVCTSSGKIGHSLSFGKADAVTVISPSATLSDALATSLGNRVRAEKDIGEVIAGAKNFKDLIGVVIICGKKIGFAGKVKIVSL